MGGYLLWAVPLALLGVALLALVLRRRRAQSRRARQTRPPAYAPSSRLPPLPKAAKPAQPAPPAPPAAAPPGSTADRIAAQREAAAEALRQARRRAAAETARLEASRLARLAASEASGARMGTAAPSRPPQTAPPLSALPSAAAAPPPFGPRVAPPLSPLPPSPLPPSRPVGPGLPPTVLVVDDSKVVRIKTSRLLEKHNYRVLLAEDGLSAVTCLETQPADLLITDVEMPGLDGFGLTQRLRASPRWASLPVIMITSSDDKHRAEAAAAGVDVLMGKPYDELALLAEVQRALTRVQRSVATGLALQ